MSTLKFAAIWCCFLELVATVSDGPSMASDNIKKPVTFEEGYLVLQGVVDRVINMVEGVNNQKFTADEYMEYYTYPSHYLCIFCFYVHRDSSQLIDIYIFSFYHYPSI